MPTDTAAYNALLAKYPVSSTFHDRKRCAKHWLCLRHTTVRIAAMGTTSSIDPGDAPRDAVPVAQLLNIGDATESYYGLLPQDEASYVLWVNQKPSSTLAEWRIVGTLKSGQKVFGEASDLTYCHKPFGSPGMTDADFESDKVKELGKCNVSEGTTASSTRTSSLSFASIFEWVHHLEAVVLTYARTGGGWIECANGCCT